MGKNKTKLLVVTLFLLGGVNTYGADANNSETKPTTVSSSSANPNMQNSANTSQKQNNSSATLSKVIGVGMMALGAYNVSKGNACSAQCGGAGSGCCSMAPMFYGMAAMNFMMGAQSFMQAKNNSGAAYNSGLTGLDTSAWNNPFGDPNSPNTSNPLTDDSNKDKDLAAQVNTGKFNEIKTQLTTSGIGGFKMDPKTGKLTTKDGKTYDPATMTTPESFKDAGFSAESIAGAMDAAAKLEKAAMKKLGLTEGIGAATATNGYQEGSDSGGTMSGKAGDVTMDSSGYGARGIASSGAVKVPSNQIAGLTKNFNGERIGVSAENIFNMMARRYKTKEKQNSFFDPSELVKMPQ